MAWPGEATTTARRRGGDGGPSLGADVAEVRVGDPVDAVVVGKKNVIATSRAAGTLFAIDPESARVVRGPERLDTPSAVATGFGSVWVASAAAGELLRFGPGHRRVPERIAVGAEPSDIAVDERWVWVANRGSSTVSRVDPYTGRVDESEVPDPPSAIAAADGAVWTASGEGGSLVPIESTSVSAKAPKAGAAVGAVASPGDLTISEGSLWVTDASRARSASSLSTTAPRSAIRSSSEAPRGRSAPVSAASGRRHRGRNGRQARPRDRRGRGIGRRRRASAGTLGRPEGGLGRPTPGPGTWWRITP